MQQWGMTSLVIHRNSAPLERPLVLLAPFPTDARLWDDVVNRLDGRAITVDPPGFGSSPTLAETSLDAYAAAVLAGLDSLGVREFSVAGNSMGGYAAMAVAAVAPERVVGLGLLGTKATSDDDAARANRIGMAERAEAGATASELVGAMIEKLISPTTRDRQPSVAARLEGWLAEAPVPGIAWAQRAMAARPDRLALLRSLDVPAVVLHGRDDVLMGEADAAAMADALGVSLGVVDCGHLLPLEAPDAVADALAPFAASGSSATLTSPDADTREAGGAGGGGGGSW